MACPLTSYLVVANGHGRLFRRAGLVVLVEGGHRVGEPFPVDGRRIDKGGCAPPDRVQKRKRPFGRLAVDAIARNPTAHVRNHRTDRPCDPAVHQAVRQRAFPTQENAAPVVVGCVDRTELTNRRRGDVVDGAHRTRPRNRGAPNLLRIHVVVHAAVHVVVHVTVHVVVHGRNPPAWRRTIPDDRVILDDRPTVGGSSGSSGGGVTGVSSPPEAGSVSSSISAAIPQAVVTVSSVATTARPSSASGSAATRPHSIRLAVDRRTENAVAIQDRMIQGQIPRQLDESTLVAGIIGGNQLIRRVKRPHDDGLRLAHRAVRRIPEGQNQRLGQQRIAAVPRTARWPAVQVRPGDERTPAWPAESTTSRSSSRTRTLP